MVPGLRADVALPGRVEAVVSPRTCVHSPSPCLLCALNWMHTLTLRLPWEESWESHQSTVTIGRKGASHSRG